MQSEIDRWVDRERQTAGETGTDYMGEKGMWRIMPAPCEKSSFMYRDFSEMEKNDHSPPLTPLHWWYFTNHYHMAGLNHFLYSVTFHSQAKGNRD